MQFPAYDSRPPSQPTEPAPRQRVRDLQPVLDIDGTEETLVPGVQKALNGARKAETRVARLVRDKKRAEQQWLEYVKDSRAAYVREHDRHQKALLAFDKDLTEALEQQRQARLLLRHAAIQEELPVANDMEVDHGAVGAEWEQMVAGWEKEKEAQDDALLRRAFQEREDRFAEARTPSGRRAAPRSPAAGGLNDAMAPMRAPRDSGQVPPAYNKRSPVTPAARSDPYPVVSPVISQAAMAMEGGDGASRTEARAASGTTPLQRPAPHGDLADKLHARRTAMMPFGGPPGLEIQCPEAMTTAAPAFLDDDLDEEDTVPEPPPGSADIE